jgi:hypothetical protein
MLASIYESTVRHSPDTNIIFTNMATFSFFSVLIRKELLEWNLLYETNFMQLLSSVYGQLSQ